MTKDPLVQQFLDRSEDAIGEAKLRFGPALRGLALRILGSAEDAEEVENDVYLEAWNKIPPAEPDSLKSWLFMVCRRRALDRLEERLAKKRGGGEAALALEELDAFLPGEDGRDWAESIGRKELLGRFLKDLPERERRVFLKRYWYFLTVREIAAEEDLSESHVKILLFRSRRELKKRLQKEELWNE